MASCHICGLFVWTPRYGNLKEEVTEAIFCLMKSNSEYFFEETGFSLVILIASKVSFSFSLCSSSSQMKRSATPPLMAPPTVNNNTGMPFSVSDILQPLDMDASTSYKRSMEMAQALAAASNSSSSSVYSAQRPSSSVTPASLGNPSFASSSIPANYYGSSSTSTFSPNNQYYDYSGSFPNGAGVNGQYSSSSCWYGPAASKYSTVQLEKLISVF